jgi:integrase
LNTGLRLGELTRLLWSDVDLTHMIVTVREESMRKTGGKVPINRDAAEIFRTRRERRKNDSPLVFPPIYGEHGRENISQLFKAVINNVGLNKGIPEDDRQRRVVFHTFRHTFASWLALSGTDIYVIKELMRHKTIQMTMRYAHLCPSVTHSAVANLRPKVALRTEEIGKQ